MKPQKTKQQPAKFTFFSKSSKKTDGIEDTDKSLSESDIVTTTDNNVSPAEKSQPIPIILRQKKLDYTSPRSCGSDNFALSVSPPHFDLGDTNVFSTYKICCEPKKERSYAPIVPDSTDTTDNCNYKSSSSSDSSTCSSPAPLSTSP